jgi:hypothetical protein
MEKYSSLSNKKTAANTAERLLTKASRSAIFGQNQKITKKIRTELYVSNPRPSARQY